MAMMTIEEKLRVPLDAEEESLGRGFNGFNDAVRSPRAGMERRRDGFNGLVMGTVDAHGARLDDPMQEALGSDSYRMTKLRCRSRLAVLQRIRPLRFDVLIQAAAECHIERLHPAADPE